MVVHNVGRESRNMSSWRRLPPALVTARLVIVLLVVMLVGRTNGFSFLPPPTTRPAFRFSSTTTSLQQSAPSTSNAVQMSSNEDLQRGIAAIRVSNNALFDMLEALRTNVDFRFYSVDVLGSCEYMPQELVECYTEACEIYPVDEDEVRMV